VPASAKSRCQGSTSIAFQYDNANRRTQLTLPNGIVVAYSYDSDSRVSGMTWTLAGNQIGDLEYSYDADGHVVEKTGSMAETNLPTAVSGNIFNADNEMTAFNGTALTYDGNGNLTNDGSNTYSWDARNHLSAISGAVAASFAYDALGRRVSKTIAGTSTQFLYDGLNPVQEIQSGTPSANLLAGLRLDEYFQRADSSGADDYLTDALGSTLALADASGAVQTSYTYEPFGNTTVSGASSTNSYQFTGRENDGTSLYFYRARYYSPTLQRFIAQDPIGFDGGDADLYGYAGNNPATWGDPLGWASPPPGIPYPPPNIPGGPWTWSPNRQNPGRGGVFIGPKPPKGPRRERTYSPSPGPGKKPYWKTYGPGGPPQRYDENGNPISPGEAHPPSSGSEGPSSGEKMIIVGGVVIVGGTIIILTGGAGGLVFAF
jgi:RHS repeat-associated protein